MKKRITSLLIGALLAMLFLSSCSKEGAQTASTTPVTTFEMIAHRGFDAQFPEDTIIAAEKAMELGANPECDVQFTLDGEMVVIHDDTVDRTTDGTGVVKELTYAYIESLEAGAYLSDEYAGEKIPKFADYLAAVKDAVHIYPELKSYRDTPDIETFTKTLLDSGFEEKATIQSFDYQTVLPVVRTLSTKIRVGALCSTQEVFDANKELAKQDGNSILLISAKIATAKNLAACKAAGVDVGVWTVKDQSQLESLMKIGYAKLMLSKCMTAD